MIESYDVGSIHVKRAAKNFLKCFKHTKRKILAGIDVPNYPQFRDMNEMFLQIIDRIERIREGYVETGSLCLKEGQRGKTILVKGQHIIALE